MIKAKTDLRNQEISKLYDGLFENYISPNNLRSYKHILLDSQTEKEIKSILNKFLDEDKQIKTGYMATAFS